MPSRRGEVGKPMPSGSTVLETPELPPVKGEDCVFASSWKAGDTVELKGLSSSHHLNGRKGTLLRLDSEAGRWEVDLGVGKKESGSQVVRVRPVNLCGDHILIHRKGCRPQRVHRSDWTRPEDAILSASSLFAQASMPIGKKVEGGFRGEIQICLDGSPPEEYTPPSILVVRSKTKLWDEEELLSSLRRLLPDHRAVRAGVDWEASSDSGFVKSALCMVQASHADLSLVSVAVRTPSNTHRFGMLQALSGEDPNMTLALLGKGHVVIEPTEAVVYHSDNMIKLPSSLSLEQAMRKVRSMVAGSSEGEEACPICLESVTNSVFMPCDCNALVHAACLQSLVDDHNETCPVCRSPLVI